MLDRLRSDFVLLTLAIAAVGLVLAATLGLHALVDPAHEGSSSGRIDDVAVSHEESTVRAR